MKRLDLPGKKCDLNNFHFGLLIFPVSIAGYFVACRDKYEVKENARRFAITVPLMFFGEKVITRPIHRLYEKLFKTKIIEDNKNNEFKVLNQLEIKNKNLLEDVEKRMLKAKNCAYATTFLINTFVIASAVSLLNRFATKKSFDKNNSNSKSTQIDNFLTPLKHPDKTT